MTDILTLGDPTSPEDNLELTNFEFGITTEANTFLGDFEAIIGMSYNFNIDE